MSTAALSDRPPLHAVPPPTTTDRFALLLRIRRAARRALDLALAVPRTAAGWVIRQTRTLLAGASANGLLTGAGSLLRSALGVVRAVGVIPVTATLLSSPPVWRATVRAASAIGRALTSFALVDIPEDHDGIVRPEHHR
jgi:hypothetical protein